MKTTKISGSRGSSNMTDLKSGMSRHNPKRPDASMTCKGGSVNADAIRGGVAAPVKTIGPRNA